MVPLLHCWTITRVGQYLWIIKACDFPLLFKYLPEHLRIIQINSDPSHFLRFNTSCLPNYCPRYFPRWQAIEHVATTQYRTFITLFGRPPWLLAILTVPSKARILEGLINSPSSINLRWYLSCFLASSFIFTKVASGLRFHRSMKVCESGSCNFIISFSTAISTPAVRSKFTKAFLKHQAIVRR